MARTTNASMLSAKVSTQLRCVIKQVVYYSSCASNLEGRFRPATFLFPDPLWKETLCVHPQKNSIKTDDDQKLNPEVTFGILKKQVVIYLIY